MTSKLLAICFTKDQADYVEQLRLAEKCLNVTKEQIEDVSLAEASGAAKPYTVAGKYYKTGADLWLVTADAP